MTRIYLGRHVYGLAAVTFGVITFVWHDFNNWQQIRALGNVAHREILVYIAAAIEIFGGVAIQWPGTARAGAFALGSRYLIFALLWVPHIAAEPRVFDRWATFSSNFLWSPVH
jgi:predicted membrane channel-forming protein YqfA (hemolysin III family)